MTKEGSSMEYRFYYRVEGQTQIKYANTLPIELVDKMVEECFVDDSVVFAIIGYDKNQDMDIPIFSGIRSEYDRKKEKQKIKYLSERE